MPHPQDRLQSCAFFARTLLWRQCLKSQARKFTHPRETAIGSAIAHRRCQRHSVAGALSGPGAPLGPMRRCRPPRNRPMDRPRGPFSARRPSRFGLSGFRPGFPARPAVIPRLPSYCANSHRGRVPPALAGALGHATAQRHLEPYLARPRHRARGAGCNGRQAGRRAPSSMPSRARIGNRAYRHLVMHPARSAPDLDQWRLRSFRAAAWLIHQSRQLPHPLYTRLCAANAGAAGRGHRHLRRFQFRCPDYHRQGQSALDAHHRNRRWHRR